MREKFEFNKEENEWIYFPFVISKDQFEKINWMKFNNEFNSILNRRNDIQNISVKSIKEYAKAIKFFTDEEFEDLEFGIFDITLNILDSKIVDFIVNYGVDENENSKIYWKDIYGVWSVYFKDDKILKTTRK